MLHFFVSHIRSHLFRSIAMFLISSISMIVLIVLLFCYQNIVGALSHYSYDIVDEHRFTLRGDTNLFSLFAKNATWLPNTIVPELESSGKFDRVQSFSLVELPVVAKFSFFTFWLETDIPVFSVTDSAITGSGIPVGISRSMLDFYNMQFAGSSAMFPKINEAFIIGQTTKITFGASKIFPSLPNIATPIDGTIALISNDFPGFWLIIPESIVRQKMQEVGYTLAAPYKIVAYMKDIQDRTLVEQKYGAFHPEFDIDAIAKNQEKIYFFQRVFLGISFFMISIFGIFFIFLLFSFFRERRDVFRVIYIFWLSGFRARVLTLAEPIILLISGGLAGSIANTIIIARLVEIWTQELMIRGISYQLIPVHIYTTMSICLGFFIFFSGVVMLLEYVWRKKVLMR